MNKLSESDIEEFNEHGFLLVKNCFTKSEIEEAIKKTTDFETMQPNDWESGKEMAYYETSKNNSQRIIMRVENYVDYHKISIANTLLGGYFGSRLMQNIREDKGWTYGIHSSIIHYEDASSLVISTDVLKDKGDQTIREIKAEIDLLKNESKRLAVKAKTTINPKISIDP